MDLVSLDPHGREIRSIRGREISMIFQEPMTSLSPVHSIGNQIVEAIMLHSAGTRFLMGSTWFWIKFCEGQERIPLTYIDSQRTSAGLSS